MARLTPSNFHPILSVPLSESYLDPPSTCTAHVLLSLPPALFLDPWQPPVSNAHQHHLSGVNASDENPTQPGTITAVHYLGAGGQGGRGVELEKAVGWTTVEKSKRRKIKSTPRSSASTSANGNDQVPLNPHAAGSDSDDNDSPYETVTRKKFIAGQGIVEETVKVLRQGHAEPDVDETLPPTINTYSPPRKSNRSERETVLFDIATKQHEGAIKRALKTALNVADSNQLLDARGQAVDTLRLTVPLHARYLPPLDGTDDEDDDEQGLSSSMTALLDHILAPFRGGSSENHGNYNDVTIEGLEAFWACSKPQSSLDGDAAWESVTRESSLIQSVISPLSPLTLSLPRRRSILSSFTISQAPHSPSTPATPTDYRVNHLPLQKD